MRSPFLLVYQGDLHERWHGRGVLLWLLRGLHVDGDCVIGWEAANPCAILIKAVCEVERVRKIDLLDGHLIGGDCDEPRSAGSFGE